VFFVAVVVVVFVVVVVVVAVAVFLVLLLLLLLLFLCYCCCCAVVVAVFVILLFQIPFGNFVYMLLILDALSIPQGVGVSQLFAIYWLAARMFVAVNICGDCFVASIVQHRSDLKFARYVYFYQFRITSSCCCCCVLCFFKSGCGGDRDDVDVTVAFI